VKFEELINTFIDNKVGLCEHFLTAGLAKLLQQDLLDLDSDNRMLPAGIGNSTVKDLNQKKRGDKIYWLDKKNNNANELAFLQQIERFISYLNETCYTGINAYEFHYALYDTGSAYLRHKDQFKNNQDRKYSLITYLNDDWVDADGGALMIYQQANTEKILPTSQKAVFFQSNEMEHEVLVAIRPRMSITGWLKSS
jgi:Rps23 Pro-64 3,4-dihydroxylase Tpa1-like proline 4-hydroxylase